MKDWLPASLFIEAHLRAAIKVTRQQLQNTPRAGARDHWLRRIQQYRTKLAKLYEVT